MNLPDAIRTARWMVRDTLRQSLATKLFWVMLAVTGVATLLCLSVEVPPDPRPPRLDVEVPAVVTETEAVRLGLHKLHREGRIPAVPEPHQLDPAFRARALAEGREEAARGGARVIADQAMTLGFGAVAVPIARHPEDSVRFLMLWLAGAAADTIGVLLALLWTAGFLPTFLEPQSATVLLAKPAPRWAVLLGKYLGVLLFVGLQAVLFIGGTWVALGLKTGVWFGAYWLAVPLLVLNFGVFYAVSAFLAVATRSTVASAFGVLLFWLLCWAVNFTEHRLALYPAEAFAGAAGLMDVAYWVLPKPLDLGGIFYDAMLAEGYAVKVEELKLVQDAGRFHPGLAVLSSVGFAAATLGLAAYEFEMTDY